MFQDFKVAYLRKHVRVRKVERLSFLRQSVAYILSEACRTIPHAAMVTELDVTPLVAYGKSADERLSQDVTTLDEKALFRRAIHRNFSAFFAKAIAHSLHHISCMNGFLHYAPWRNGGTLYRAEDVNLGFTVHTKYGVIKPVIRNAHQKPLEQVAQEMRDLTRRARNTDPELLYREAAAEYAKVALRELDFSALKALWILLRGSLWNRHVPEPGYDDIPPEKKLRVHEILGATCTLANIGMMVPGHQTLMVIQPPEVMMFGLGDLHLAPRVVGGEIKPRYVITMSGAMDHRAFDAGEAFPFVAHVRRYLENPALLYEWKPGDPI
jgi:pyruvate/2-oxoglutarate dehydrogenase complex dihydrolipoamide acyltransferase (E2) component